MVKKQKDKKILRDLIAKHNIDPKAQNEVLEFIDKIKLKTPEPTFFYEYKRNRTQMLKKEETKPPERYYKQYLR